MALRRVFRKNVERRHLRRAQFCIVLLNNETSVPERRGTIGAQKCTDVQEVQISN